jgi:tetratricopeptide (TPR) repeat protein
MSKLTRREKHIHAQAAVMPGNESFVLPFKRLTSVSWLLLSILFITAMVYLPAMNGQFVWDDVHYVQNNPQLRTFDLQYIFSSYVMGNYHPFTMLFFSIEYQLFGGNTAGYHLVNLLLHLSNVILVFYTIRSLSKKDTIALIAALFFGIHPLHTESVAWISEQKDLLYTFFFLASYLTYLKYSDTKDKRFFYLSILFFAFSLLSKAMAASLPVLLLLTDYFKYKKLETRKLVEKIPYFLLAVIFGIVAVFAQKSSAAIQDIGSFPIAQRLMFASYGFVTYLWKLIIPVHLSAFYPYPIRNGEQLPSYFYIFPIVLIALITYAFYSIRTSKYLFFGIGFFAITIFLVLQLLPVGDAVMADRYSYIPSIGIFFLAGICFDWLWRQNKKILAAAVFGSFFLFFSVTTFSRNKIWKNSTVLWTDVVNKYPTAAVGHNNLGGTLLNEKKYDEALLHLDLALSLQPNYAEALGNRGIILSTQKKYDAAIKDLDKAILLKPGYADAFNNRGIVLMELLKYPEALADFNKAIELRPGYAEAYYNRGLLYMNEKKYDEALKEYNQALALQPGYTEAIINKNIILGYSSNPDDVLKNYSKSIEEKPDDPQLYYSRGMLFLDMKKYDEALKDFNKAISLKPDFADVYNARGNFFISQKDLPDALNDFTKAIELNASLADAYLNRGNVYRDQNNDELANKDYNKALDLNPQLINAYFNRGILYIKQKKFDAVISDFSRVLELKGDSAMSFYNRGMAEYFLGQKDKACNDLEQASLKGVQQAKDAKKQFCQ